MSSERVRIGVVGAGWWSTAMHLPAIADHPEAVLAGIADTDLAKAQRSADVFGAERAVAGYDELLALDVDCLVVATPHDTHFPPARDALERGIDVLVEKPMVLRVAEATELVRISEQRGAHLHVGYTGLYTRHVEHLRQTVAAGGLGDVALATGMFATAMRTLFERISEPSLAGTPRALFAPDADTYADPRRGGGQAWSQLSHPLALLLHVLDVAPTEILTLWETHGGAVDVSDVVAFRAGTGTLVSVASTGVFRSPARPIEEYRFVGEAGQAFLDTAAGTLRYATAGAVEVPQLAEDELYPAHEPVNRLIDSKLGKTTVLASGELGLRVTRILEALSANQGADDDQPL